MCAFNNYDEELKVLERAGHAWYDRIKLITLNRFFNKCVGQHSSLYYIARNANPPGQHVHNVRCTGTLGI